jgi:predicted SAM-dependent methyltransferase
MSRGSYYCPVCDRSINHLMPAWDLLCDLETNSYKGNIFELETFNFLKYRCPYCGATDRDRFLVYFLRKYAADLTRISGVVLDIGSKMRVVKANKLLFGPKYRSADLSSRQVDLNFDLMDMNIVESNSISILISSHVLEHVADDTKAVSEMFRVLAIGGSALILVPLDKSISKTKHADESFTCQDRWQSLLDGTHERLYSRTGLEESFASAGFVKSYFTFSDIAPDDRERLGVSKDSRLYIFTKPRHAI